MKLDTVRFGQIDIEESRIFDFVLPIIGFDAIKKFVILEPNKDSLFKWLQAVEDPALAFPIISVESLDLDYTIDEIEAINELFSLDEEDEELDYEFTTEDIKLLENCDSLEENWDEEFEKIYSSLE